jgi:ankyrin repeat protein
MQSSTRTPRKEKQHCIGHPVWGTSSYALVDRAWYGCELLQGRYDGSTPCHIASLNGHPDVVSMLIEHDADVNSPDDEGSTSLHGASQRGHLNIVRLLLDHSANIHTQRTDLWTPLHLALTGGHSDAVELLIRRGVDVDKQNKEQKSALHHAYDGRLEVVRLLVKCGSIADLKDDTIAHSSMKWTS